jgi:pyruvate/2-oxoglutarate dehydrogenase complex dihydrolipoamide acyltransferase (E2) component
MRRECVLRVPPLGGDRIIVAEWKASPGDRVSPPSELVVLETDKVTFSMEAETNAILKEIRLPAGSEAHEGDILGILDIDESPGD